MECTSPQEVGNLAIVPNTTGGAETTERGFTAAHMPFAEFDQVEQHMVREAFDTERPVDSAGRVAVSHGTASS